MYALTKNATDLERTNSRPYMARWLRRLCALSSQAMVYAATLPRFFGSYLAGIFFASVLLFGIIAGGHSEQALKMMTSSLGLAVAKVEITGLVRTSEIDVLTAMRFDGDSAMLAFDVGQAHAHIMALPWVQSARLRKNYPNQIEVAIVERKPLALWQHRDRLDIIDEKGDVIIPFSMGQGNYLGHALPLLVGRGANRHGTQILALAEKFEHFKSKIRAYRRIGDRRWDIVLDNGIEIKLPERNFDERLTQMLALDDAEQLLSRDILSIDLRVADRMNIALSDEALARWRKHADQVNKTRKQAKQKMEGHG